MIAERKWDEMPLGVGVHIAFIFSFITYVLAQVHFAGSKNGAVTLG